MLHTFKGGVHPKYFRYLTRNRSLMIASLPEKVSIPLSQHIGIPAEPVVKRGDYVKVGTMIARGTKFISTSIHSSISGVVSAIENQPHPVLGSAPAIIIEGDGKDEYEAVSTNNPESLSADEILDILKQKGIVGLGGATFPTHAKLTLPKGKKVDTFILNGAECEPYLTGDYRIMVEKTEEIIGGLKIIKKLLNAERSYIGIEKDKPEAIRRFRELLDNEENIEVVPLKVKYPQGGEKQLIKTILNREVPSGGLPVDVGCIVNNVGTALSVYEAIRHGKPLYQRVVTVTGSIVRNPGNLIVRIGTRIGELIDQCGGLTEKAGKIIVGGPMMGFAQHTLDVPVIKSTTGILCLSEKEAEKEGELPCIHCARCVDVCPMGLLPTEMRKEIRAGHWETLKEYNLLDCIECGCCEFSCPANIPLVQLFKLGKSEIRRIERL